MLLYGNGEVQRIMYIKTTVVLDVEVCDVPIGIWGGEEVISSCGLLGAWSSTGVVVCHFLPAMCLAAYINQLVGVECLL